MKQVKRTFFVIAAIVAACFFGTNDVKAQEFTVQGDLVSSYVWRGVYQTGASFQPTLGFGIGGFSLTAWGSTDFDGYKSTEQGDRPDGSLRIRRVRSVTVCGKPLVGGTGCPAVFQLQKS